LYGYKKVRGLYGHLPRKTSNILLTQTLTYDLQENFTVVIQKYNGSGRLHTPNEQVADVGE